MHKNRRFRGPDGVNKGPHSVPYSTLLLYQDDYGYDEYDWDECMTMTTMIMCMVTMTMMTITVMTDILYN